MPEGTPSGEAVARGYRHRWCEAGGVLVPGVGWCWGQKVVQTRVERMFFCENALGSLGIKRVQRGLALEYAGGARSARFEAEEEECLGASGLSRACSSSFWDSNRPAEELL